MWWQVPVTDPQAIFRKEYVNQFIDMFFRMFRAGSLDPLTTPMVTETGTTVSLSELASFFNVRDALVNMLRYGFRKSAVSAGTYLSLNRDNPDIVPFYRDEEGMCHFSPWFLDALNDNHPRGGVASGITPGAFLPPSGETVHYGTVSGDDPFPWNGDAFPWTRKYTVAPADAENPQPGEWPDIVSAAAGGDGSQLPGDIYGPWLFEETYALMVTIQTELMFPTYYLGVVPSVRVTWRNIEGYSGVPEVVADLAGFVEGALASGTVTEGEFIGGEGAGPIGYISVYASTYDDWNGESTNAGVGFYKQSARYSASGPAAGYGLVALVIVHDSKLNFSAPPWWDPFGMTHWFGEFTDIIDDYDAFYEFSAGGYGDRFAKITAVVEVAADSVSESAEIGSLGTRPSISLVPYDGATNDYVFTAEYNSLSPGPGSRIFAAFPAPADLQPDQPNPLDP